MPGSDATEIRSRPHPDPRPARTRAVIVAAAERALAHPGAEVTVNTIAAEAGISRSTFYTQFGGLDELAIHLLGNVFAEIELEDLRLRPRRSPLETATRTSQLLVSHFAARRSFYTTVLDWKVGGEVFQAMRQAYAAQALGTMQAAAPAGVDPRLAADFIAAGSVTLLIDWIRSPAPADAELIRRHLVALLPPWLNAAEAAPETTAKPR